ncbi:MAG: 4Fe-4S ferredoxin [Deltaproteobacteria bacterium]|nr:4Fe-4S ferredoxin [Deltaproteobacteria bacterium]
MSDEIYHRLAKVLDTLPNGFPSTESGVEIKLLKKVFTPDEADLFCDLRLTMETADQVADRTGRPKEGLEGMLTSMWERGEVFGVDLGGVKLFKMIPWVLGVYEFQLNRMDREFAQMCEEYAPYFAKGFFENKPQFMKVVPIEEDVPAGSETLVYDQVSAIIEAGQSFAVADCICKKEKALLDLRCDKPMEVCMAVAPVPGVMDKSPWGRPITKEEAYGVLKMAEKAGLVHMTHNVQSGHYFICNCCGCCCGILRGINEYGYTDAVNSKYYARIDAESCIACGICADERCQVNAISEVDDYYAVDKNRCIGCGLCVSTCPEEAISLLEKPEAEIAVPPVDENDWYKVRGEGRGVDFSKFM